MPLPLSRSTVPVLELGGTLRDDRAGQGRHRHLAAQHRLLQGHRQVHADVVAVAGHEGMGRHRHGQQDVAIGPPPRPAPPRPFTRTTWPSFTPDRNLDVDLLAILQHHPAGAAVGGFRRS